MLKNKKTKKNTHTGAGLFSINNKTYTNIKYGKCKSSYIKNKLVCLQCKYDVFRRHNGLHSSRFRAAILNTDVFDKSYHIFVCNNCGFMMNYSGDISYNSKSKSSFDAETYDPNTNSSTNNNNYYNASQSLQQQPQPQQITIIKSNTNRTGSRRSGSRRTGSRRSGSRRTGSRRSGSRRLIRIQ